jgi:hypothetical protein
VVGGFTYLTAYNSSSQSQIYVRQDAVSLPLTLLSFSGKLTGDDGLMQWTTTDEINTASYIIERSIDGRNYKATGHVKASNTTGTHSYQFIDAAITSLPTTVVYYRLKMTDLDGHSRYSRIVTLPLNKDQQAIMVYPNPVERTVSLAVTLTTTDVVHATIYDNSGKVMKLQQWSLQAGSHALYMDMGQLPAGIYYLELKGSHLRYTKQLIKQ